MILIKDVDENTLVEIHGHKTEILSELTLIIRHVRDMLYEDMDKEYADKLIANCGRLAYMTTEEVAEELEQKRENTLDKLKDIMETLEGELE